MSDQFNTHMKPVSLEAGDNLERVLTSKVASYGVANASHEWRAAKKGYKSE